MVATIIDLQYRKLVAKLQKGKTLEGVEDYKLETNGILMYHNIIYVSNVQDLKLAILKEMHNVPFVEHPGYQKTVTAVKSHYFWLGMKKEIVEYIARCMECKKVKVEHRHPAGLL